MLEAAGHIENITGADGTIGVGRAARAAPDGYLLSVGQWSTHVLNGAVFALPYDLLTDLEPIALLTSNPQLIVARNGVPANNLSELIAWLKANPGKASQGTAGAGTRVAGAFFQSLSGTSFAFVPYRGSAPAMQDLIGGRIDLMFDQVANSLAQVRAGNIKAFAITAKTRLALAPRSRSVAIRKVETSTVPPISYACHGSQSCPSESKCTDLMDWRAVQPPIAAAASSRIERAI